MMTEPLFVYEQQTIIGPKKLLKIYVFVQLKLKRQCHFSVIQAIISKTLNQQ